jgi:catalase-peroxidase
MKYKLLIVLAFLLTLSCDNKTNDRLGESSETEGGCPLGFDKMMTSTQDSNQGTTSKDFWPNSLDLDVLRQNSGKSDPMSDEFNYREEFSKLDYEALKKDIEMALTDSKEWWPADFGNYGGLFIRMAWHSAGTYRTGDGRGGSRAGQQRFAPLNSWPDNANLDKSRRLLWPIKQKYGQKISWADLMILAGNVAYESMGFETLGFSGGRVDVWEPESDVYWGAENEWLANNKRYDEEGNLEKPLAAVQMGLIYVNPEGPNGNPDPKLAAHNIRETFGRMGMNDEETVALIAGGHTLGKTHGAAPGKYLGKNPEAANIENQGFGWESTYKSGKGPDAITSGLEVTWTLTPTEWNHGYFKSLFENEWELVKSPGGAHQFQAVNPEKMYPDAFDEDKSHKPTMLVTDLSMIEDPAYRKISERFYKNPKEFEEAFAKAWFKLTHRDMGPKSTYIGPEVPQEDFLWQDPIPQVDYEMISAADIKKLKAQILDSGLSTGDLVKTAWAAASTYRDSDRKGGANGGRLRLEPQANWESNNPEQLKEILKVYENIQKEFNSNSGSKKVSMADLIVLGGNASIEQAAAKAGFEISVPFNPGRADAGQEETDVEGMAVLEPMADGFRNYIKTDYTLSPEQLLVDKAQLLTLTPPEMTVLIGGMRALDANFDNSKVGVLTDTPGTLNNNFFRNLLSMEYEWKPTTVQRKMFEGYERGSDNKKWTASRVDLIFGSNSELRALAEVYSADDAKEKFVNDFVKAWTKVMNLDRFDLKYNQ